MMPAQNQILACILMLLSFRAITKVYGQGPVALGALKKEIAAMSNDPLFKFGQIGFSLRGADGKTIYEFNGDKSLIPASNLKLITTATALQMLGGDFRFETKLSYDGSLKNGTLHGNLYIEGGGDPTLGSDRFEGYPAMEELMLHWTAQVKKAGITHIKGSIVADASIFGNNPIPDGWIWTDIGNYYGAGATGITINENLYRLVFKPGKTVGDPTEVIRTEPSVNFRFDNQVRTGAPGSGDNAYIFGSPYSLHRYLSGTIPAGVTEFKIKGSMPDPAMFTAELLNQSLTASGVDIGQSPCRFSDSVRVSKNAERTVIFTQYSPPLKDIIRYTNFFSINLYAESLLKIMAVKKGLAGETENGLHTIAGFWKSKDVDIAGMFLHDGSGLSPQTALRPSQMTRILQLMSGDSVFVRSIPVAGESGTLKRFCKGSKAEKKIIAKSGTLSKVICYSGYVRSKNGKLNPFSIFINNYNGSSSAVISKIETIMSLLVEI